MAIKYLSGKRLQGTSAERTSLNTSPAPQTRWKELGRATAGSGGSTSLTTSAFTAKDNIMILYNSFGSDPYMRVGTGGTIDTTQKYSQRYSEMGGTDGTNLQGSTYGLQWYVNGGASATGSEGVFGFAEGINLNGHEKLFTLRSTDNASGTGSGTATGRYEREMKYNVNNQINIARLFHSSGTMDEGSEIIILGCDNDEADSGTNFWQELANVSSTATDDSITTGTITAKKYLWVQFQANYTGDGNTKMIFNSDSGSNKYAFRSSYNGSSDSVNENQSAMNFADSSTHDGIFVNVFILNRANREKIFYSTQNNAPATGSGSNPNGYEQTGKWINTSDQITEITMNQTNSGSYTYKNLKVWGSD